MSMLSAQRDELRAMAESVGLEIPQAATLMMKAADTIWELRCKLSGTVDERERMFRANVEKNRDLMRLMDENAKLRMLVHALLQCHVEDTDTCAKCKYRSPLHGGCMADVKADELGVEP